MHPAGDETGEMRHVDQKFGTDLVGDLAEAAEIEDARIGGPASDDDLRPKLTRKLRHLIKIDPVIVPAHAIGYWLEPAS